MLSPRRYVRVLHEHFLGRPRATFLLTPKTSDRRGRKVTTYFTGRCDGDSSTLVRPPPTEQMLLELRSRTSASL